MSRRALKIALTLYAIFTLATAAAVLLAERSKPCKGLCEEDEHCWEMCVSRGHCPYSRQPSEPIKHQKEHYYYSRRRASSEEE